MQMKTLTVNGQTYTVTDPTALREEDVGGFVCADKQQTFTQAQQAQARANIGAAGVLLVDVLDGNVAGADAGQVYTAVQNGYDVVLYYQGIYYPLAFSSEEQAYFSCVYDDYTARIFRLKPNAIVEEVNLTFASLERYRQDLREIETAMDAQQEQINANTAAIQAIGTQGGGFELLAETVLTEDAAQIGWTQGANGQQLKDYKDFFIYWSGGFSETVNSSSTTANRAFICFANGGAHYFQYVSNMSKSSTQAQGGWYFIEEIANDDNMIVWKAQHPQTLLNNYTGANQYSTQGLGGAMATTNTTICCRAAEDGYNLAQIRDITEIRFGNQTSGTVNFTAGTKAMLYGRAR